MDQDKVVELKIPEALQDDPLTAVLRDGARRLLAQAVEAEVSAFLAEHADKVTADGRRRVVRNGYLPERDIQTGIGQTGIGQTGIGQTGIGQTGIGAVAVRQPRVRDRGAAGAEAPIRFTSALLPRYLRRPRSLEDLLPWLDLKGVSTGDFGDALAALLGPNAPGLSAATISRLKEAWQDDLELWQKRDLSAQRYVYFWADGVYFDARLEERQCILVVIGATEQGRKELVAIPDGDRESEQSWRELLLDLKQRGLTQGPELAIGDGALGFWKALRQVYGKTREQRCWVHKTANVLNKLPTSLQPKAKKHLQDIWMAETRKDADKAFDFFIAAYGAKYDKAVDCLIKGREVLLTFYHFPAEHWKHIRTTNPIESTFATVRLRTGKTTGCLSRQTALTMVFRLCQCAEKTWRRLDGSEHLGELIGGGPFVDGIKKTSQEQPQEKAAA